jgi:glycosyltransferase involved in cell wall biosynthesis
MKVVIVSHYYLPHVGGVEILVDRQIRALCARGHEVVLVTSDEGTGKSPASLPRRARLVRVPVWNGLERHCHLAFPLFSPRLLLPLWEEVGRCDVVHAHGPLFMSSVLALLIGRLRGRPCILTDHGGIQRYGSPVVTGAARFGVETVGRLSAHLASRLVSFNSRITRLLERLSGTSNKTLFLPNPVDRSTFGPPSPEERRAARARLGWSDDHRKVLFVGRLIPDKGFPLLLQAADPSYDLVFCGPGDSTLLGTPLPPRVEYLTPRPHADLVSLYHAADVLVLPSLREGFPLVVQEALVCGLPVVLTADEGYTPYADLPGLTFTARSPSAIRTAVLRALADSPALHQGWSPEMEELCPSVDSWLDRLFEGMDLPPEPAGRVEARVPIEHAAPEESYAGGA